MVFLLPACGEAPLQESSSPEPSTEDTSQITDSTTPETTLPLEFGDLPVGSVLWEAPIEDEVVKLQLFVENRIVVWSAFGSVRSFDPETGEAGWTTDLDPDRDTNNVSFVWPVSSPGRLHLMWNGTLWTLNLDDGEVEWVASSPFFHIAAVGNRVAALGPYLGRGPVPLSVLDAETGDVVWVDEEANAQQIGVTEVVVAGMKVDATNAMQVVAWDISSGDSVWSSEVFQTSSPLSFALAIPAVVHVDDALVFASARFLASVDATTGSTLWSREMDEQASTFVEPMASGGWVVTNQDDAPEDTEEQYESLVGIDPRAGVNGWSLRVSTLPSGGVVYPFCGAAAGTASTVFYLSYYGGGPANLIVDTLQGQPLWQMPPGNCPASTDDTRVFVIEPGATPRLVAYGPPEGL
jgi:outer membrane protein assembly factor BamB